MLTEKQAKFVASYQLTGNQVEAAINAGYSSKSAPEISSRLIRHPKIVAELANWKAKKSQELTKQDFVDIAMDRFHQLEVTEPNSPRFLDLAGKALGYTGANQDQRSQTINNLTQININGSERPEELWEMTRKLLGNE